MSRHYIEHQRYNITLGWDRPLNTFFATIIDEEQKNDFDEPLLWMGVSPGEYTDIHHFLKLLKQTMQEQGIENVDIPESFADKLREDQMKQGQGFQERPTEIQNLVLKSRSLRHQ
ncbi:MAG: hypothetical protein F6J86_06740 [Symploca sp. SIO1B1]|nr:hypothetical protein [Symploca sp. SIO1B1]